MCETQKLGLPYNFCYNLCELKSSEVLREMIFQNKDILKWNCSLWCLLQTPSEIFSINKYLKAFKKLSRSRTIFSERDGKLDKKNFCLISIRKSIIDGCCLKDLMLPRKSFWKCLLILACWYDNPTQSCRIHWGNSREWRQHFIRSQLGRNEIKVLSSKLQNKLSMIKFLLFLRFSEVSTHETAQWQTSSLSLNFFRIS